jgi:hypothetical protein
VSAKPVVAEPNISALVDEGTQGRLLAYARAVNADFALVGYVYKTSDTQLTAGTALFSVKRGAFSALPPVTFDTDVLTANTESFRLGDEVTRRLTSFGTPASLPINLVTRAAKAGTSASARVDTPTKVDPEDLDAATPTAKKVVLVPREQPKPRPEPVVEVEPAPVDDAPRVEEKKSSVGWIIVGVVAGAALLGTGAFFGIAAATQSGPFGPVTGTVTATW